MLETGGKGAKGGSQIASLSDWRDVVKPTEKVKVKKVLQVVCMRVSTCVQMYVFGGIVPFLFY